MAEGIEGGEGKPALHDVIDADLAITYLEERGYNDAATMIKETEKQTFTYDYWGCGDERTKNRYRFGHIVNDIIHDMDDDERADNILVIDCDLEGSTGLQPIREAHPDIYVKGGVMERNNYSVAAGFGQDGRQAIYGTFSAFSEMVNSEIQMARLNESNVLAHFSHAGVDWMADNTCHFGMNIFFTDNGLATEDKTKLYFPADQHQLRAVLTNVFWDDGLRFIFSTRSSVPDIHDEHGNTYFKDYDFTPGKDDIIREGEGYVVSYGAMLHRSLDAVERLRHDGLNVGLINKTTLNVQDHDMMDRLANAPYVLVAEAQNKKTGLGVRFGTWLLQHGFTGVYDHIGTTKEGHGGVYEQLPHQGLDSASIQDKLRAMVEPTAYDLHD
jgi:transketolase C-terminal domain/subunit